MGGFELLIGCLVAGVVFVAFEIYAAYHAVEQMPRQDMYVCPIHGPMAAGSLYTLFGGMEMDQVLDGMETRKPIRGCPLCFEDRVKDAEMLRKKS